MWNNIPLQFTPKLVTVLQHGYSRDDFKGDLLAGLTVAIVALPLSMAIAIASGTSPDKGLVTAVIAGFLISALGGSRVQIGGPTGAFIVVVFDVITRHGYDGLLLATFIAGIILIISGYMRLGQVLKFIPHPVITGFTAGIAVIIASSQIKDFFGIKVPHLPAEFIPKIIALGENAATTNLYTLGIGIASLAFILWMRKVAPKMPFLLMAVALAGFATWLFGLPTDTIGSRFPDMPRGLPMPSLPDWSFAKVQEVIPSAFVIAFLAGIESLLSAVVADGMTGFKHRPNQELVGQGVANIVSVLFGGFCATGAIARTATNIRAGGKTPVAGMLHAVFVLLFLLFFVDIIQVVPLAVLSAILFVVAWNMAEIDNFIHIYHLSKYDRISMVLTFLLTVLVDLTVGIGIGVTLASLLFVHQMTEATSVRAQGGAAHEEDDEDVSDAEKQRYQLPEGVEVFRITGPVFFGVAGNMIEALHAIGRTPNVLIVRMGQSPYMDVAGLNGLKMLVDECLHWGAKVIFSGLQEQPAEMMRKGGIFDKPSMVASAPDYESAITLATRLAAGSKPTA